MGFAPVWAFLRTALVSPPMGKIARLAVAGADSSTLESYRHMGARMKCVRPVSAPLRCVDSGVNSYAAFCSLVFLPLFPHSGDTALLRSATFRPGTTFRNYIDRPT